MSREIDTRDFAVSRLTPERVETFYALADTVSWSLPGPERIRIRSFDLPTGNPYLITSHFAAPASGDFPQRALEYLTNIKAVFGFEARSAAHFAAAGAVQHGSSGATTVHVQQKHMSIPIFQANQAIRFSPDGGLQGVAGRVVSVVTDASIAPTLTANEAVSRAAQHVALPQDDELADKDPFGVPLSLKRVDTSGFSPTRIALFAESPEQHTVLEAGPFGDRITASLCWFPVGDCLLLCWMVVIALPEYSGLYRTLIDAQDGKIVYCKQLIQYALGRGTVFPWGGSHTPELRTFPCALGDHALPIDSIPPGFPDEWISHDSTIGNSTAARQMFTNQACKGSITDQIVTFAPPADSVEQKMLNVFYYFCFMHDHLYLLGFREADGNFQMDNLGRGGIPGDRVKAFVYPGEVYGTASIYTPVDGGGPVLNTGLVPSTNRHAALDATVLIHEYVHGMTTRLVGGPANDQALEMPQSRGLAEGISDFFACTVTQQTTIGSWLLDNPRGSRLYPYDDKYPDHFGLLGTGRYTEQHNIGEIIGATLLQISRLIGAPLAQQLVVDALKLVPANPGFLDMRNALLAALDNMCLAGKLALAERNAKRDACWQVFARFGMGTEAQSNGASLYGIVADHSLPARGGDEIIWGTTHRIGTTTDRFPTGTRVAVVARVAACLDVLAVAYDGYAYNSRYDEAQGRFGPFQRIGSTNHSVLPGTPLTVVASGPRRLDAMMTDADGTICYAYWEEGGKWQGWWRIASGTNVALPHSKLAAVAEPSGAVDLFVVGVDGGIYASRRDAGGTWWGWLRFGWPLPQVLPLSPITAIARREGGVHLFVVGRDGGIYAISHDQRGSSGPTWMRIGIPSVPPGSVVSAIDRGRALLDLFVVGFDGGVYTTCWDASGRTPAVWLRIGVLSIAPGSAVSAVACRPERLDLFVTGIDGDAYAASWSEERGTWLAWHRLPAMMDSVLPVSGATAISRKTDSLDIFFVGSDGTIVTAPGKFQL